MNKCQSETYSLIFILLVKSIRQKNCHKDFQSGKIFVQNFKLSKIQHVGFIQVNELYPKVQTPPLAQFFGNNNFFGQHFLLPKILLVPKFLLDKIFLTQNYFCIFVKQKIIWTIFLLTTISFWTHIFLGPKIFLDPKFF